MKAEVVIVGAGVIGLSLAWELGRRGRTVIVVERGEPGREASYAAGGMLAWCDDHLPEALLPMAAASARLYPEFVREVEEASGASADLRTYGAIVFDHGQPGLLRDACKKLTLAELSQLEPKMQAVSTNIQFWAEASVDPRGLVEALVRAVKHRGVHLAHGEQALGLETENRRVTGLKTTKASFLAPVVVNCAGAWAAQLATGLEPTPTPTRPVKGQMLALVPLGHHGENVRHVVRSQEVYIIPRSDGRVVIGATVEEAGFDKRTDLSTTQRLHKSAAAIVPELAHARIHETWAGLRPGTPDGLPILGATSLPGYFVATGHYRDGILLAPVTAQLIAQLICDESVELSLSPFSPLRFSA